MKITTIETDNFRRVFKILDKITVSIPPLQLKKCNKIIKELIFSNVPTEKLKVNLNDLQNINSTDCIIAFTKEENYAPYDKNKIYESALFDNNKTKPKELLQSFTSWQCTEMLPFYFYIKKLNIDPKHVLISSDKFIKYFNRKKNWYNEQRKKNYPFLWITILSLIILTKT